MNAIDTPDPEFVNRVEWELVSVLRRKGSVNGSTGAARRIGTRVVTTLVLASVSMFVGGAGTYAAIHTIDEQTAALHIIRCESLLEIAKTQLDTCFEKMSRMQALVEDGAATDQELLQVDAELRQAESNVKIRELELAETRLTGKEPNDALSAHRVAGTDYVTERMIARKAPLQRRVELAANQVSRLQGLVDAGLATERELENAQVQLAAAEEELAALEKRIQLRASFLAGELTAAEVELKEIRRTAVTVKRTATRRVQVLIQEHRRITVLVQRNVASRTELRRVEAELRSAEAQVELAEVELRIIDKKLQSDSKR